MIQNILRHLGGVEQYGVVSLCLFGTLFGAVLLWALLQRKGHLERMARVPFEDDPAETLHQPPTHE